MAKKIWEIAERLMEGPAVAPGSGPFTETLKGIEDLFSVRGEVGPIKGALTNVAKELDRMEVLDPDPNHSKKTNQAWENLIRAIRDWDRGGT